MISSREIPSSPGCSIMRAARSSRIRLPALVSMSWRLNFCTDSSLSGCSCSSYPELEGPLCKQVVARGVLFGVEKLMRHIVGLIGVQYGRPVGAVPSLGFDH